MVNDQLAMINIKLKGTSNNFQFVTPAQAGVQLCQELMDSCFRRNDIFRDSLNFSVNFIDEKNKGKRDR